MGILTTLKLGAIGVLVIASAYFVWNYQHRGKVIEAQKIQIQELEAAEKYYKAQPKIDEHTKEMTREVKKATESGDADRVKWLYEQLRKHKADKGKTSGQAGNDGDDE